MSEDEVSSDLDQLMRESELSQILDLVDVDYQGKQRLKALFSSNRTNCFQSSGSYGESNKNKYLGQYLEWKQTVIGYGSLKTTDLPFGNHQKPLCQPEYQESLRWSKLKQRSLESNHTISQLPIGASQTRQAKQIQLVMTKLSHVEIVPQRVQTSNKSPVLGSSVVEKDVNTTKESQSLKLSYQVMIQNPPGRGPINKTSTITSSVGVPITLSKNSHTNYPKAVFTTGSNPASLESNINQLNLRHKMNETQPCPMDELLKSDSPVKNQVPKKLHSTIIRDPKTTLKELIQEHRKKVVDILNSTN